MKKRAEFKQRILTLESQLLCRLTGGIKSIKGLRDCKASGLIMRITDLSGKAVLESVTIVAGLSEDTKKAILVDLTKTLNHSLDLNGINRI